jgi:hypothetical protein
VRRGDGNDQKGLSDAAAFWKHLREFKRAFWKRGMKAAKREIARWG